MGVSGLERDSQPERFYNDAKAMEIFFGRNCRNSKVDHCQRIGCAQINDDQASKSQIPAITSTSAWRKTRAENNCGSKFDVARLLHMGAKTAQADPNYDAGVKLYAKKDYRGATSYFSRALNSNPGNCMAMYYLALSFQGQNDWSHARAYYAQLVRDYGNTQQGMASAKILAQYEPTLLKSLAAQRPGMAMPSGGRESGPRMSGGGEDLGQINAPDGICRIPFEKNHDGTLMVDCLVNNRSAKMVFDTGAEPTLIPINLCESMGIPKPTTAPTSQTHGVGSSKGVPCWTVRTTVKLGQVEKRNFPVTISGNPMEFGLIGETFMHGFRVSIDPGSKVIAMVREGSSTATAMQRGGGNEVPFHRQGREMVVQALVNGRPIDVFFDTGAASNCFTKEDMQKLGIPIPEDAQDGQSIGVAGHADTKSFNVRSIKVGSVEVNNVPVTVLYGPFAMGALF